MVEMDPTIVATSVMDSLSSTVWPILWSLVVLVIIMFLYWYLQFRHTARILILTSNGVVPYEDKAREVKIEGVPYWKLRKRKDILPVPPRESMNSLGRDAIFNKPKFYSEMYWSEEHGYIPIQNRVNKENINEFINGETDDVYKPLTPAQRALYTTQLRKAEGRRKKNIWDTIAQMATPLVLAMLFICVLVFWEDIAKPAKDMAAMQANLVKENAKVTSELSEISAQNARMIEILARDVDGKLNQINQRVQQEGGG